MANTRNFNIEDMVNLCKTGTPYQKELAMEQIIINNDNLIRSTIKRYYSSYRHNYAEDMLQEGRRAILEHALDFDAAKGTFSTFIVPYIKDAIKLYICELHGLTTHYASQIKKYNKAIDALKATGVENPMFGEIAEKMGVGIDAVKRVHDMSAHMNAVSIEGDGKDKELYSDPYTTTPEVMAEVKDTKDTLHAAIAELPEKERQVITACFFAEDKELSLAVVAKLLGMDVSEVRRLKNRALRHLKESSRLMDYDITSKRRALEDFADSIEISFDLPRDMVEADINIALTIDEDIELAL